jgi:two-component system chemotaxis response regulator CheB
MDLFLYEPNARTREIVAGVLRGSGHAVRECTSREMIAAVLARSADGTPPTVLGDAQHAKVVEGTGRTVRFVAYRAEEVAARPEHAVAALMTRAQGELRRARMSERPRYKFDLVCIGSSTGGFPVVQRVVEEVRFTTSSLIICQHVGADMARDLRDALQKRAAVDVTLVEGTTRVVPGRIHLLAGPGDFQFGTWGSELRLNRTIDADAVYHPSFDGLLESLLALRDVSAAAMVLSGLGEDGARHLPALRAAGRTVVAQSPEDAVAKGMPSAAIKTRAVNHVNTTDALHDFLIRSLS